MWQRTRDVGTLGGLGRHGVCSGGPDELPEGHRRRSFTSDLVVDVIEYPDGDEDGWSGERREEVYDYRGERYIDLFPKLAGHRRCSLDYEGSRVHFFDAPGRV